MPTVIHTPSLERNLVVLYEKMSFLSEALSAFADVGAQNYKGETTLEAGALRGCARLCETMLGELAQCMNIAEAMKEENTGRTA